MAAADCQRLVARCDCRSDCDDAVRTSANCTFDATSQFGSARSNGERALTAARGATEGGDATRRDDRMAASDSAQATSESVELQHRPHHAIPPCTPTLERSCAATAISLLRCAFGHSKVTHEKSREETSFHLDPLGSVFRLSQRCAAAASTRKQVNRMDKIPLCRFVAVVSKFRARE